MPKLNPSFQILLAALKARCFCGKDHQPVAAYGVWCCPDALKAAQETVSR